MPQTDYNEADTCLNLINPKLLQAGWHEPPHSITRERPFTDGRIIVDQSGHRRGKRKIADYILRYRYDYPIAVVEAKRAGLPASDGLQQAKEYAEILGLKFAYATNGREIIEYDYTTGKLSTLTDFPAPSELWLRLSGAEHIDESVEEQCTSSKPLGHKRYFAKRHFPQFYPIFSSGRPSQQMLCPS